MSKFERDFPKLQTIAAKAEKLIAILIDAEDHASREDLDICIIRAESFFNSIDSFFELQEKICSVVPDEASKHFLKLVDDFERMAFVIKAKHKNLNRILEKMLDTSKKSANVFSTSNLKLPSLKIPMFTGKLSAYQSFKELFASLFDKNLQLSDVEKMHYLLAHLDGEPLSLLKGLPIVAANYKIAIELLDKRYLNIRCIANQYIQNLNKIPIVVERSPSSIRKVFDHFSENWMALKALLPRGEDQLNLLVVNLLLSKLDAKTREMFELEIAENLGNIPSVDLLLDFMSKQGNALGNLETFGSTKSGKYEKHDRHEKRGQSTSFNTKALQSFVVKAIEACAFCKSEHKLTVCDKFLTKSPWERYKWSKENHLCLLCLKDSHMIKSCKTQSVCSVCTGRHHTLLHYARGHSGDRKNKSSLPLPSAASTRELSEAASSSHRADPSCNAIFSGMAETQSVVLLGTAVVHVINTCNVPVPIRILIDCGSQVNFVSENCIQKLGLARKHSSLVIRGLGQASTKSRGTVTVTLKPRQNSNSSLTVTAQILREICGHMPSANVENKYWSHLQNLNLADPYFEKGRQIDMLIGADVFPQILLGNVISGIKGQPCAINTIFGYVVMGKTSSKQQTNADCYFVESILEENIKRFWELEQVPQSQVVEPCEKHFIENFSRNPDGRYVVALPFKENAPPIFGDTYSTAWSCLKSLEFRLSKNDDMRSAYHEAMRDYIDSGHLSLAGPRPPNVFYVPHHGVCKPQSTSTQLRVVMNASSRASNGISLNDSLLPGPKLHTDIVEVLLNFRRHKFGFIADIKQMFRMILVCEEHRDFQRILWRFSSSEPAKEYVMNRVMFGVTSAPFLALRTLKQLAVDESIDFPRASKILLSDVYVDDVISGDISVEDTQTLISELISLLKRGGFELKKFASNEPLVVESLNTSLRQSISFDKDEPSYVKVLGLQWHPATDCFSYNIGSQEKECTKRSILSDLARIFDPLGFLAPVVVFAKHLIQKLWILGLDWDQKPPADIVASWKTFQLELPCLKKVAIRRFFELERMFSCELHGFCDSSEIAFAASIYFRITCSSGEIRTVLVISRSKVAPLKRLSIPRLELCAAVLLADLVEFVLKVFKNTIHFSKVCAWSDSQTVLSWIKAPSYNWKTFVANRVALIQEHLPGQFWFYVPSFENPCDCASRGLLPAQLLKHLLWWVGPTWLCQSADMFPAQPTKSSTREEIKESTCLVVDLVTDWVAWIDKFSSLSKLQRVFSYCLRFVNHTRKIRQFSNLFTVTELHHSLLILIKIIQQIEFKMEIHQLKKGKICCRSIRNLNPFLDSDGLIRVGGRLRHSSLKYNSKHPLLLPSKSHLTWLIIDHYHNIYLHPGYNNLVAMLRRQFWILSPHRSVRSVVTKCLKCFRVAPKRAIPPIMGDLPEHRVSEVKAFRNTGVDFGGPFTITSSRLRGAKLLKAYLCLFVCFTTKAVHLECASSLSTEAFLAAFRRFLARRGACLHIHSDCGTNFVAANKAIIDCFRSAVAAENLVWHFNPPAAPHMGGLWEAGIKSVKRHLGKVIGDQVLTFEELSTIFSQIEAILNSRPLFASSSDPNDIQAITPAHFLTIEPVGTFYEEDVSDINMSRLSRWQRIQAIHQHFWRRWNKEYLHTLQQRKSFLSEGTPIEVGMLVLICSDLAPPLQWKLGRIVALHPGADGKIRVVTIRTASGLLKRPVVKLCPLPNQ